MRVDPDGRALQAGDPSDPSTLRHEVDLDLDAEDCLEAVAHLAEVWGGEWHRMGTGGKLSLPVAAGVRYGWVESVVSTRNARKDETSLIVDQERAEYRVHLPAVAILAIGAAGGLLTVFAPFVATPEDETLAAMLVLGFFLLIITWFLVVSKIRHRGVSEFVEELSELVAESSGVDEEPLDETRSGQGIPTA